MGDPVAAGRAGEPGPPNWSNGQGRPSGQGWSGPRGEPGRVVRKVLVTAAIGGVTYLLTALTQQSQITALTLSAFLGGVALVVQFLADFEARLATLERGQDRQATQMRLLVEEKFSAVSEATELFGRVQSSVLRPHVVTLVRHANSIVHDDPQLIRDLAQSQLERTAKLMRELSGGSEVVYEDGEDRDWLLALTRGVRTSIDATSRGSVGTEGQFVDEGLWSTELGHRYLEAQRAAVRRGVAIRRVFMLERPELAGDPAFRSLIRQQQSTGITLRTINFADMRASEQAFVADLIVFDGAVSYESTLAPPIAGAPPMFVGTTLVIEPERVRQRADRFDALWEAARELD